MSEHRIRQIEKMHMHSETLPEITRENVHEHCLYAKDIEKHCETLKEKFRAYFFEGGLVYIPCPLKNSAKSEIVEEILTKLLYSPYRNSIDRVLDVESLNLYENFRNKTRSILVKRLQHPLTGLKIKQNPNATEEEKIARSKGEIEISPEDLIKKIRWSSLGIYYDWEKKEYDRSLVRHVPEIIQRACKEVAEHVCGTASFRTETAVVNYYQSKDRIMTHVDRYEEDMSKPLVSFSFGCSAVFVVGKKEKTDPRVSTFLLQDGDIVILQNESREYLHGVPKILQENTGHADYAAKEYAPLITHSRINISVRQAYKYED